MDTRGSVTRRRFVQGAGAAGLGLLAGCGRVPGQAAPPRLYRVGVLGVGSPDLYTERIGALEQGLIERGHVEGRDFLVEARIAETGQQLPGLADELVRLPVDVLVVGGTPAIQAARDAAGGVPIVMASGADPVGSGFVASLARPGGNVTGLSRYSGPLYEMQVELLTAAVPGAARLAVLSNPDNPGLGPAYAQVERAAEALGMQAQLVNARGPGDLEAAFAAAAREQADSLIMLQDSVLYSYHRRVIDLAGRYRLPAVAGEQGFARDGGLLAYGTSAAGLYRRAAYYVDRILKGDRPADLPVEQPMAFDFVINLNTAQALGLTIPQQVLLQATEVLQ